MKNPVKRTLKDVQISKEDEEAIKEALGIASKNGTCTSEEIALAYKVNQIFAGIANFYDELALDCEKKATELVKEANDMWLNGRLSLHGAFGREADALKTSAEGYRRIADDNRKKAIAVINVVNGKKEVEPTL